MFIPDPGSEFFPSRIPDPHLTIYGKYFNPKKIVSKHSEIGSGLFIPDLDPGFHPSRIQGSKKAPNP
jgi:hypothetical protein